jgi:hypothetical protein
MRAANRPLGHIFERGGSSLSRALSWTASISARWQASQVRRWTRNAAARSESSSPSTKAMRSSHGLVGSGIRLGDSTIPHMSDLVSEIASPSRPLQARGGIMPPATSTLTNLSMFFPLPRKNDQSHAVFVPSDGTLRSRDRDVSRCLLALKFRRNCGSPRSEASAVQHRLQPFTSALQPSADRPDRNVQLVGDRLVAHVLDVAPLDDPTQVRLECLDRRP